MNYRRTDAELHEVSGRRGPPDPKRMIVIKIVIIRETRIHVPYLHTFDLWPVGCTFILLWLKVRTFIPLTFGQ